jgi:RNA recognition motif-containing protein
MADVHSSSNGSDSTAFNGDRQAVAKNDVNAQPSNSSGAPKNTQLEGQSQKTNGTHTDITNGIETNGNHDQYTYANPDEDEEFFLPREPVEKGPPQACLFVASLSPSTTEDSIRTLFSQHGEVIRVKLLKDRSSRPYSFVQFKRTEDALNALQSVNNAMLDGRRLRVEKAKVNRTLFIAKMDRAMPSSQLREMMELYGPVENVTIIKNHQTNRSKGCGFVKFVYREDAMEAFANLKNNPFKWVIEWATSTNDPAATDASGIDRTNIFVGGLNPSLVTKDLLEQRFSSYGRLEGVTLVNRELDNAEGERSVSPPRSAFAFIRYADAESATTAIEAENGAEWLERRIRVQYCESQEMKNKRKQVKYFAPMQFSSQYYRGMQGQYPVVMMGGVPVYANMATAPVYRKGDPSAYQNPYVGYSYINPGMIYGGQWAAAYAQGNAVTLSPPLSPHAFPMSQTASSPEDPMMGHGEVVDGDTVLAESLAALNITSQQVAPAFQDGNWPK